MIWTISLGTLIDNISAPRATRSEIYTSAKRPAEPCRSCSAQFSDTWRTAHRVGLIVHVGRRLAIRGWDVLDLDAARL